MPEVVRRLRDDDGDDCNDPLWHIMDCGAGDAPRVLCTGEALDACSDLVVESKTTKRGGITCPKCMEIIREFKALKL